MLIRESPAQFDNRIKPRVYARLIMHSNMYMYEKLHLVNRKRRKENYFLSM